MAQRGLPLQIASMRYLQLLLSARLQSSQDAIIGENGVDCYIKRHKGLCSKYTQNYDYQRAKCENPELTERWFQRVHGTIQRYGILFEDTYNMDETGFQMGYISTTTKVICSIASNQRPTVLYAEYVLLPLTKPQLRHVGSLLISIIAFLFVLPFLRSYVSLRFRLPMNEYFLPPIYSP